METPRGSERGRETAVVRERLERATLSLKRGKNSKAAIRDIDMNVGGALQYHLHAVLRDAIAAIPIRYAQDLHAIVSDTLYRAGSGSPMPLDKATKERHTRERWSDERPNPSYALGPDSDYLAAPDEVAAYTDLLRLCTRRSKEKKVLHYAHHRGGGKADYILLAGLEYVAIYLGFSGDEKGSGSLPALATMDTVLGKGYKPRQTESGKGESDIRAVTRANVARNMPTPRGALAFLDRHARDYHDAPEVATAYFSILKYECRGLYAAGMTLRQLSAIAERKAKWLLDALDQKDAAELRPAVGSIGGKEYAADAIVPTGVEGVPRNRYGELIERLTTAWNEFQAEKSAPLQQAA